jgi:hypothetical protein
LQPNQDSDEDTSSENDYKKPNSKDQKKKDVPQLPKVEGPILVDL